jgi:hypothetical protein
MRRFFDKRATLVDVTDKEVIGLFQDGLYHCRTFEDFGRRRPSFITKLKDMITSWADEQDKANAKYDAIRGKSKQNAGDINNNNRDQGGRNNNYSGPNRKCKPDNTVAAIQRPAKDNSKTLQTHGLLTTRKARKKSTKVTATSKNPTRR